MTNEHEVIVIAADERQEQPEWSERQIRVAAYCRVSTDMEEQLSSYEAQKDYYTTKIMENPNWMMAGIFADEGLSATSAKKRPEFQKMLRKCKQGKIDLILTKSVSRFARNTLDSITITRELRNIGVAVHFEKENVNTMEMDSEFVLTILSSLAQAESESISRNVAWGKRQAMKSGKVMNFSHIYGYKLDEDDVPQIVPEEAAVVRRIFDWYLAGASVIQIVNRLSEEQISTPTSKEKWTESTIRGLLRNEKYCGDVIQQKTFVSDVISKRIIKNNGQLPKYLIKNYHDPIINRDLFYKTQTEIARRTGTVRTQNDTNRNFYKYSGKYALTGVLICAECGSAYKRTTWRKRSGEKQIVWRCINRLDNGKRYCRNSPTLQEYVIQEAILEAIKANFKPEDWLVADYVPQKLAKRQWSHEDSQDIKALKKSLIDMLSNVDHVELLSLMDTANAEVIRLQHAEAMLTETLLQMQSAQNENQTEETPLEWSETLVRNLVSKVIVQNENQLVLKFKNGKQITLVISS